MFSFSTLKLCACEGVACVCVSRGLRRLSWVLLRPLLKECMWNGRKAGWGRTYSDVWAWLLFTHIKLTQVNTHKQSSGLKTDVLNQRPSTRVLISFISSYIFVLIASCIFTIHFCSVLPCLVKIKKNSNNILWSVFLLISRLCSNIFLHAAIGQRMRH